LVNNTGENSEKVCRSTDHGASDAQSGEEIRSNGEEIRPIGEETRIGQRDLVCDDIVTPLEDDARAALDHVPPAVVDLGTGSVSISGQVPATLNGRESASGSAASSPIEGRAHEQHVVESIEHGAADRISAGGRLWPPGLLRGECQHALNMALLSLRSILMGRFAIVF
jgi:hypothetical protein